MKLSVQLPYMRVIIIKDEHIDFTVLVRVIKVSSDGMLLWKYQKKKAPRLIKERMVNTF